MADERVRVAINEEGVAEVTLNRPEKHNGLDMAMFYAIDNTIQKFKKNKAIRAVIVSGEGPCFSSGLDIKSVTKDKLNLLRLIWKPWPTRTNLVQRVSVGWRGLRVPVIMCLHGQCWGGGLQIALGGDFRIASPDTTLAIMENKFGFMPDMGGSLGLRENVPVDRMLLLAMTADPVTAEQALAMHLVTEVVERPLERARELARTLASRPKRTNAALKSLYHECYDKTAGSLLAAETYRGLKVILANRRA